MVALSASVVLLASLSVGCQGETQVGGATDASTDTEIDSRAAFDGGQPEAESGGSAEAGGPATEAGSGDDAPSCSRYTLCSLIDGVYNCDCDAGMLPACPSNASSSVTCDYPPPPHIACLGCTPGIGAFTCACVDGDGGSRWVCVGSGFACQ